MKGIMGQTVAEKILSRRAGRALRAGDIAVLPVDGVMATDSTGPLALKAFAEMGGKRPWDPKRVALVLDHATPAPNERVANLHALLRDFAAEHGCVFYDVGAGICHQLMIENDHVAPGDLFLGADSHTPTYGAIGAFAVGVGSTDLAAAMLTGKTWLKVPTTVRVELRGRLAPGVTAKDVILRLVGRLGADGAAYEAVEFGGEAVAPLTLASRMTLANMVAEMGAKAGLVDLDGLDRPEAAAADLAPDPDADYRTRVEFDVTELRPQVAVPHAPDRVVDLEQVLGRRIDAAFIGSCTNGRLEDLREAAEVVRGRRLGVRLVVAPASREVFAAALADGTVAVLTAAGASFIPAGCGPCVGTHQGVPGDGEAVISSSNRNFRGRMGNPNAEIYLASPAVVAAAAVAGRIADPAEFVSGAA